MCDQQPEIVRSWGHHPVDGDGLTVSIYRNPDRLVIEIHAPMDLLNLEALTKTDTLNSCPHGIEPSKC